MSYYSRLFDATLKEEPSEEREDVLTTIAHCATELYPEELYDKLKDAFENGLIDEFLIISEKWTKRWPRAKTPSCRGFAKTGIITWWKARSRKWNGGPGIANLTMM